MSKRKSQLEIAAGDPFIFGGVISAEPFIVLGKRMPVMGSHLGLISYRPDLFENCPSLSLLTLAHTHEAPSQVRRLVQDLSDLAQRLPLAKVVMLANTEAEVRAFHEAGIKCLLANELIFGEISAYHPPTKPVDKSYDAVYVGRLDPQKRHELATDIKSLLCLYYRTGLSVLDKYRTLLPNAVFGNHDFNNNEFRLLTGEHYFEALGSCHVGLCLSLEEGAMRASIEYQLCGLPVVTTPNRGGRDRFLQHGFALTAAPDPQEIAKAVNILKNAEFPASDVRANAVTLIENDRAQFLEDIRDVIFETFGSDSPDLDRFEIFEKACGQRTRPLAKTLKPTFPLT